MRVAILGIGSIGGVILAGLADTELELVAVSRGSTAQALSSEGLVIHTPEGVICLLYTSPSPRDRTRSRMPSSA